jgi:DNA-binding CsgD family transcriptional regulator
VYATDAGSGKPLSDRHTEIVRRLATGQTNREIAYALGISESTVKNHLTIIYAKLRVSNRTQLAAMVAQGMIEGVKAPSVTHDGMPYEDTSVAHDEAETPALEGEHV